MSTHKFCAAAILALALCATAVASPDENLLVAVGDGDAARIEKALAAGADPNYVDPEIKHSIIATSPAYLHATTSGIRR